MANECNHVTNVVRLDTMLEYAGIKMISAVFVGRKDTCKKKKKTRKCFSRHHSVSFQVKVHQVREEQPLDEGESDSTDSFLYCLIGSTNVKPFEVRVIVDSIPLQMEIVTGATSSLIAERSYGQLGSWIIQRSKKRLNIY